MHFASLGSGSQGNGLLVRQDKTAVLVDCGFSLVETERRCARLGFDPATLTAILVTHEHSDHIDGVARLSRRYGVPVCASFGTLSFIRQELDENLIRVLETDVPAHLGDLEVTPFAVPHDAREPLQYVIGNGRSRLGVLTDAGHSTPHMVAMLRDCHGLFLETNHDVEMLMSGNYPPMLKERVGGRYGHLSNQQAGELLAEIISSSLQRVVAAHLSKKNNTLALAQAALAPVLGCAAAEVNVATQDEGCEWVELG
jgi:phosphoribosyl 1,2-cyclic phosphodiesterase